MQTYDYIIVGAGSVGAAVANRLSANPRNKVLLLEAGRASHPWSFIPIGMASLITNPAANWLYSSEPELRARVRARRKDKEINVPGRDRIWPRKTNSQSLRFSAALAN